MRQLPIVWFLQMKQVICIEHVHSKWNKEGTERKRTQSKEKMQIENRIIVGVTNIGNRRIWKERNKTEKWTIGALSVERRLVKADDTYRYIPIFAYNVY